MAEHDDPADAAMRLEQALERIALLARAPSPPPPPGPEVDTARIAARLDGLIAELRAVLSSPPAG